MRPARETMSDGEGTYIQLIASASPVLTYRTLRDASEADNTDMSVLSSDIVNNLIYIGDCSDFVLSAECSEAGGTVTVTPLILNESLTVESVLESHTFTASTLRRGTGNYLTVQKPWNTEGAGIIAVHIKAISDSNSIVIRGGALSEKKYFKCAVSPQTDNDDGHSHAGQLEKDAGYLEFGLSKV